MEKEKTFPTGKKHISFSEVRIWKECSWKHKLMYIDAVAETESSVYLSYGTILHEALEHYVLTREMKSDDAVKKIEDEWETQGFDGSEYIERCTNSAKSQGWTYRHNTVDSWTSWTKNSLNDIKVFLDETYPGWEIVSAEEALYENLEDDFYFKGFIDCIIKYKKGKKDKYVIIDWKTASPRGWNRDKKTDIKTTAQLILYKHFWSKKNNIPLRDIACNFVLLKRGAKPGKSCALVEVSAGEKSIEKSLKMVRNMIASVRRGMTLKNRESCKFCPFKGTENCK